MRSIRQIKSKGFDFKYLFVIIKLLLSRVAIGVNIIYLLV